jgi:diacylglycerol kinase (ATP)
MQIGGRTSLRKGVRSFDTVRLVVRTKKKEDVDLDGDILTKTPVTFGIRRKAVQVFVPGEGA